jgi:hypothetical protein
MKVELIGRAREAVFFYLREEGSNKPPKQPK